MIPRCISTGLQGREEDPLSLLGLAASASGLALPTVLAIQITTRGPAADHLPAQTEDDGVPAGERTAACPPGAT